jgi:hypothetical protein
MPEKHSDFCSESITISLSEIQQSDKVLDFEHIRRKKLEVAKRASFVLKCLRVTTNFTCKLVTRTGNS